MAWRAAVPAGQTSPREPGRLGVSSRLLWASPSAGRPSPPLSELRTTASRIGRPESSHRWTILAGLWAIYFCFGLTTAAMAPLVPVIANDLGLSHAAMGGVLGAWPLVYIVAAVPAGFLLDRLGLRWALALGASTIGLSGVLRSLASGPVSLWIAVAVFGLGGPLVSIGAPKLVGDRFEGRQRGLALGLCMSGPALGNVAALSLTNSVMMPLVGGDWRAVLLGYAATALAAAAVWLTVPTSARRPREDGLRDTAASGVDIVGFLSLLRARSVQLVLLLSAGIFFFNHGLNNWLPEILRTGGMDARAAGYWASLPTLVGIGGALLIPRFAAPGRQLPILVALLACAGAAAAMLASPPGVALVTALLLQGTARGSMTAVTMLVLMDLREVGARRLGAAGGLFFSVSEVGGVLGPLSIGAVYDWTGRFAPALHLLTALCALLVVLLFCVHRTTRR